MKNGRIGQREKVVIMLKTIYHKNSSVAYIARFCNLISIYNDKLGPCPCQLIGGALLFLACLSVCLSVRLSISPSSVVVTFSKSILI